MTTAAPDSTADALLDAAGALWAERGLGRASLREIGRAAGQGNTRVVQYHFGDEDGLLDAVLDRERRKIETDRAPLLDALEHDPQAKLRDHANALVRPLGERLTTPSGRHHLAIAAELFNRGTGADVRRAGGTGRGPGSLNRWRRLVLPLLDSEAAELHTRFSAVQFGHTEMARLGRRGVSAANRALVIERTIDLATALLQTPLSPATKAAITR